MGAGTLYSADTTGKLQPIPTGPALVDRRLHDLLSPAAMFDANGTVQKFVLTREGGMIVRENGIEIPMRWDGKAYHLDYFMIKNATDTSLVNDFDCAGHAYSSEAKILSESEAQKLHNVYNLESLQHQSPPHYFRVIDPVGLSFSGLEHRKYSHQNYAQLNLTRQVLGLPPLRKPHPGYKCAICAISNSRVNPIPGRGKKITNFLARKNCDCAVCRTNALQEPEILAALDVGEAISFDLLGPTRSRAFDG